MSKKHFYLKGWKYTFWTRLWWLSVCISRPFDKLRNWCELKRAAAAEDEKEMWSFYNPIREWPVLDTNVPNINVDEIKKRDADKIWNKYYDAIIGVRYKSR